MNNQTPERLKLARELAALHAGGLSYSQIGKMYGMTLDAAKGMIYHHQRKGTPREFQVIDLGAPLEIVGDAVIVGDVHVPATNWDFAHLVSRIGEKLGITTLIIAGDYFNMDHYSRFPHITNPPTWAQERDAGRLLLDDWMETFQRVYILAGNHERMMQKANEGAFENADIFATLTTSAKVTTSNFGYCRLSSGGREWRVSHGREYSVNQLTVGAELALKHQCHIISHHQHHAAVGRDRYKRYCVVDNGSLVNQDHLAYVTMDESKKPNMANAFAVIREGYPYLFDAALTDWAYWLGR
jgi:transposase